MRNYSSLSASNFFLICFHSIFMEKVYKTKWLQGRFRHLNQRAPRVGVYYVVLIDELCHIFSPPHAGVVEHLEGSPMAQSI